MSEFLGFAWELLAKVVYNVVAVVSSILNLLVFGWVEYFNIFMTYFTTFDLVGKIGAVILLAMLIAVPVLIVAILVHRYRTNRRLHRDDTSNKALYREIGRLNKQVLDLMDEKNKLLALKVNAMGGTKQIPYVGASALADDHLPTVGNVVGAAAARLRARAPRPPWCRATRRSRSMAMASRMPRPPWPRPPSRPDPCEEKNRPGQPLPQAVPCGP